LGGLWVAFGGSLAGLAAGGLSLKFVALCSGCWLNVLARCSLLAASAALDCQQKLFCCMSLLQQKQQQQHFEVTAMAGKRTRSCN